ncbi:MAG: PIG-L family deacetylase [Verrucomicrobiota bacterium]|jgi:LmbE family N-acetylglucosaminyl deacetylase
MNPYHQFAADYARLAHEGRHLPLGGFPPTPRPVIAPDAPKALLFSPHPDDECITGALALRLLREARFNLINVAVTQGSNPARQAARWTELKNACDFLGFGLVQTAPNGLERVSVKTRSAAPGEWRVKVERIAELLEAHRPRVIVLPHVRDWNSTHIGTHYLVADALAELGPTFDCFTIETEFWGQMDDPNLVVESSVADVADLIAAVSFHVGEAQRNPYHILLPAQMQDNVRRGAELVGGQGQAAPDFVFTTLYRLRRWRLGRWERAYEGGRQLGIDQSPATLFV